MVCDDLILPDEPVVTECFPQSYVINKNGVVETKEPMRNWGINGNFSPNKEKTEGRYNIAVGPKIMNPKYPDNGKISGEDFLAYNRYIDVIVKNKSTGEEKTIECYARDLKAHSYNLYPDPDFEDSYEGTPTVHIQANVESGYCQTGIRYPNADNGLEWAPDNVDASIIEFCNSSTGGINRSDYELVRVIAYFVEEQPEDGTDEENE